MKQLTDCLNKFKVNIGGNRMTKKEYIEKYGEEDNSK